ncbi:MAG: N-acetylglucosaminyldiphosphoundecaprenol N-acetyl-beta-D-mannosaminyltransferase [Verrucomicrobiales bacterium]|jgi:N-acetylglucosaminyldiphosphoundecaprenol N-acetyl-beta-D-mannosaminyltransferase
MDANKDLDSKILTKDIIGTKVAATTYAQTISQISNWARLRDRPYLVAAANTHVLSLARNNHEYRKVIDAFDLVVPDGMPLVWVLNRKYNQALKDRVYGPTLMEKTFQRSQDQQHNHLRHFLLGSSDEIRSNLRKNLEERFPKAKIVGDYSPPFGTWTESDNRKTIDLIQAVKPNIVWTCYGCPKQETWLAHHRSSLPSAVYLGIGAAFAFHAGKVKMAPRFLQNIGMEWAFRLACEPKRLFRRYLVNNLRFLFYLSTEK